MISTPQSIRLIATSFVLLACSLTCAREKSVFYPYKLVTIARDNVQNTMWAQSVRDTLVKSCEPWMRMSDDELWGLMFGNTIHRSWMVWSNGFCPACKESVPMYTWEMDALNRPWKVRCPLCKDIFPKNDFKRFYASGLDDHGVFDPSRADRSLLFNVDHPDPGDPLRLFGVDDGEGVVEGDKRWRFIGAYLIYGQWKQAIVDGTRALGRAYVLTGDPVYAHKAAILLDRVADLYATHDFSVQGIVYERQGNAGYVSTWHDACEETRWLALAYDQIRAGMRDDSELVSFLSDKASRFHPDRPKSTIAEIQANIEQGILKDAITNAGRIHSNYPRTEIALATIQAILGWPENTSEVMAIVDAMLEKATAVDGVTGEKGLAGYSAYVIQGLAEFLEQFSRSDPSFLTRCLEKHPSLRQTYRFHIDTWCQGEQYYPQSGDTGSFACLDAAYAGVSFQKSASIEPSMFSFLKRLSEATGDPAYIQVLYQANGSTLDGLPHDLFEEDREAFKKAVGEVIDKEGVHPQLQSVNKTSWHLALLRSHPGEHERTLWLDYDAGGGHGHFDGLNAGLFAFGLDLMPEFGYPPVHFGGWESPRSRWYGMTAAHNTVVVDGKNQASAAGQTTLWADGKIFKAVRASAPALADVQQYERTLCMVSISEEAFYVLDIFRVVGGQDHAKFLHSHFGSLASSGLHLEPAEDYGYGTQMRGFQKDPEAGTGWMAEWTIEDRLHLLKSPMNLRLRVVDLSRDVEAWLGEQWIAPSGYNSKEEDWIPCLMVRRQSSQASLFSTFVSVLEPYTGPSRIKKVERLDLFTEDGQMCPESDVAVCIQLADGRSDLIVASDVEDPLKQWPGPPGDKIRLQKDWSLSTDGDLAWIRRSPKGRPEMAGLNRTTRLILGKEKIAPQGTLDFQELKLNGE